MSSMQSVDQFTSGLPAQFIAALLKQATSETKYYLEDGWVFREYPGKPIELVARWTDESQIFSSGIG